MTSIVLPTTPGLISWTPRLITSRSENASAFGVSEQRISRMGSRYAFDCHVEPMTQEESWDWLEIDDEEQMCIFPIPAVGFNTGAPGAPLVDGAGQSGMSLELKGMQAYYVIRKGQWLSIITSGQRYVYRARTETIVASDGTATLPLLTMLRVPHANNDVVEIAEPKLEGFVTLPDDAWAIEGTDRLIRLSFTIKERT